jgi:DNA-binding CsgD family transcriptional regulator
MKQLTVTGLPKRQAEALLHTAHGMTRKEAARRMGCSPQNVVMLLDAVRFKLHARTAAEAVTNAFRAGVLRLMSFVLVAVLGAFASPPPSLAGDQNPPLRIRTVSTAKRSRREEFCSCASMNSNLATTFESFNYLHKGDL